jgi:hypothetical protein
MNVDSLSQHLVNGGHVQQDGKVFRLTIPPTPASEYTDAQLDDYPHEISRVFSNTVPQRLRFRARFSHTDIKGTAGFGFWNHPFSRTGAVLTTPANIWFFYSSSESDLQLSSHSTGNGLKASVLNSGQYPQPLTRLITRPLNWMLSKPLLSRIVLNLARAMVNVRESPLSFPINEWHTYEIDWRTDIATLCVDGRVVLCAQHPPRIALGFAAWIDNYCATANSRGEYSFAYVSILQEQWMELEIMNSYD